MYGDQYFLLIHYNFFSKMPEENKIFKIYYVAEVEGNKASDAEYKIALNKNLLQYLKTEIMGGNEPIIDDIEGNMIQQKLRLDLTNPEELGLFEDMMGKDAHLIEEFDWSGMVRLYFNRNTKTEIFKLPHISNNNKEFCMAIFTNEEENMYNKDEEFIIKVTETFCTPTSSFVGQIASIYMKMDLEQNTLGDMRK